jgi:DNA repair photolyase
MQTQINRTINSTDNYVNGRGAQLNTFNPFDNKRFSEENIEAIDEKYNLDIKTKYYTEYPKEIVNKITSPDVAMLYSLNPYQGCEHGCIYCYARNTHNYWGFSAGLDFEQKIVVKPDAAQLLEKTLQSKRWIGFPISFSGNTDCYQPVEREMRITRQCIEMMLKYKNPVSIITKNQLILRDIDLLKELATNNLVHVMISITTADESLRLKMEPRTATFKNRMKVVNQLSNAGIPVGVMLAPIIPGLNSKEIPNIIKQAGENGALEAGYSIVRLNGSVKEIFKDWLQKNFSTSANKIINQISECHSGQVADSRFGRRMKGEGPIAATINQLFRSAVNKYLPLRGFPKFNSELYRKEIDKVQLSIF